MPKDKWFESWFDTRYYHLLYAQRDDDEAQKLIEGLMRRLALPQGSTVCDLACGKGRHAKILAEMGYRVTGLDLSVNNVYEAGQKISGDMMFLVHDMRRPFYYNYFDLVLNLFTSFGYFENDKDHELTLGNVARALKRGGTFFIDYLNVPYVLDRLVASSRFQRKNIDFEIQRQVMDGYIVKHIQISEGEKSIRFTEKVRTFHLNDFERMMHSAGLSIEEVYGDYSLNPYDEDTSERLIIKSRKKS